MEIIAAVGACCAVLGVVITSLLTAGRIGHLSGAMEMSLTTQNAIIAEMKKEISELGKVMTQLAVQTNRVDTLSSQVTQLSARVNDLAHGEGFVFPLSAHLGKPTSR